MRLNPSLPITLLSVFACLTKADIPLTSETAGGPEATKTQVLSNYKFAFSTWKATRLPTATLNFFDCPVCVCELDMQCVIPPRQSESFFADWPGKPQFRSFAPPVPASPGLPRTATDVPDTNRRSVIVRATPTPTSEADADIGSRTTDDQQVEDGLLDKLKHKFMPGSEAAKTEDDAPDEITKTFYTYPLSGYHPVAMPLIVSSGHSNSPITILAWARSIHFSSFISSSLIADLNRSSEIRPILHPPLYTPEKDLINVLGYHCKVLGQISLDIVIGSRDRMIQDVNFTVFADAKDPKGAWRPDLLVGIDFLNAIGGIKLTEEYSGDDRAGAKDGLPVLVQRVFVGNFKDGVGESQEKVRDEL